MTSCGLPLCVGRGKGGNDLLSYVFFIACWTGQEFIACIDTDGGVPVTGFKLPNRFGTHGRVANMPAGWAWVFARERTKGRGHNLRFHGGSMGFGLVP